MDDRPFAAVLTISDGVSRGTRDDRSGDVAERILGGAGFQVGSRQVVADERSDIEEAIRSMAASHDLVVTTGGTGFGPRDVTPEATRAVLEREAPGLAELMRAAGLAHTPLAALSRGLAGTIGRALVLNLPGSPTAVREGLEAALPVVPHALELSGGATGAHPTGHAADAPDAGDRSVPPSGTAPWVEAKAVKVHGSPPCAVGNSMSIVPGGEVHGTLGCAEFDEAAVVAAAEILEAAPGAGRGAGEEPAGPQTRTFSHELGEIEVFFEPHRPAALAVVVSATDVARALRSHLRALGYDVVIVESRADRLSAGDAPSSSALASVNLDERSVVVFTDHDAPGVTEALTLLLRSPVRFIGVMGSRRHVAHYVQELRDLGFTDEDLARIRSPLGLDIGGREPEPIALSIAAGIVADEHGKDGGWLDRD